MFSDHLSGNLNLLLGQYDFGYEAAGELCGICGRTVSDVIRKKSDPKLSTIEGLCTGFAVTPNELLLPAVTKTPALHPCPACPECLCLVASCLRFGFSLTSVDTPCGKRDLCPVWSFFAN